VYGQSFTHEFELFAAHYQTLEALHKLHELLAGKRIGSHFEIPGKLAKRYGLRIPEWTRVRMPKAKGTRPSCTLSLIRNELVHEARWAKTPIGYALLRGRKSLDNELSNFNARLLLAMIGVSAPYLRTRVDDRDSYALT
jgi:hypothetical protein